MISFLILGIHLKNKYTNYHLLIKFSSLHISNLKILICFIQPVKRYWKWVTKRDTIFKCAIENQSINTISLKAIPIAEFTVKNLPIINLSVCRIQTWRSKSLQNSSPGFIYSSWISWICFINKCQLCFIKDTEEKIYSR